MRTKISSALCDAFEQRAGSHLARFEVKQVLVHCPDEPGQHQTCETIGQTKSDRPPVNYDARSFARGRRTAAGQRPAEFCTIATWVKSAALTEPMLMYQHSRSGAFGLSTQSLISAGVDKLESAVIKFESPMYNVLRSSTYTIETHARCLAIAWFQGVQKAATRRCLISQPG